MQRHLHHLVLSLPSPQGKHCHLHMLPHSPSTACTIALLPPALVPPSVTRATTLSPLALATSSAERDNIDAACSCCNIRQAPIDGNTNATYSHHGICRPLPTQCFDQSLQEGSLIDESFRHQILACVVQRSIMPYINLAKPRRARRWWMMTTLAQSQYAV